MTEIKPTVGQPHANALIGALMELTKLSIPLEATEKIIDDDQISMKAGSSSRAVQQELKSTNWNTC